MCYKLRTGQTGWDNANQKCKDEGDLQLATVDCHDTNGVIKTLLVDNPAYIGLTDSATEGTWLWVDGKPIDYKNWITGQPTVQDTQDCVVIRASGDWQHIGCSKSDATDFVCERKATC